MWNEIQVYFRTESSELMDFLTNNIQKFNTILVNTPIIHSDFDSITSTIRSATTNMELEGKVLEILVDLIRE